MSTTQQANKAITEIVNGMAKGDPVPGLKPFNAIDAKKVYIPVYKPGRKG